MKSAYSRPLMRVEAFEANEYIAACVVEEASFQCIPGEVYLEDNNIDGLQTIPGETVNGQSYEADTRLSEQASCDSDHTVTGLAVLGLLTNLFANYYVVDGSGKATKAYRWNDWGTIHYFSSVETVANYS